MLKSNEVRVGNWVQDELQMVKVKRITELGITIDCAPIDTEYFYSEISPIELNRDIFLKMGAVLETFDCLSWANLKVTCRNGSVIDFLEGDKNGFFEVLIDTEQEIRVRYVHEVQNWYFMYTGGLELDFQL